MKHSKSEITQSELQSIQAITDYLYQDEQRHFFESDIQNRPNHIFRHVIVLRGLLQNQQDAP